MDNYQPNYKDWASRNSWYVVEAATLFCELDPMFLKRDQTFNEFQHPTNFDLRIRPTYNEVRTWFQNEAHPFEWIDTAIKKCYKKLPQKLINSIKPVFLNELRISPDLIKKYYFLSKKLGLDHSFIPEKQNYHDNHPSIADEIEKPISNTKQTRYLKLIHLLCKIIASPSSKKNLKYWNGDNINYSSIAEEVSSLCADQGGKPLTGFSKENIRKLLKEAFDTTIEEP